MDLEKHLIELSGTPGLSGYEQPVRDLLTDVWRTLADDLSIDALGNLLASVYGEGPEPRPRILVTAHMDEIGLMVTAIEEGFLRITKVGGIDRRILLSQPVIVHGEQPLPGLIGSRPPHVLSASERKKYPDMEDLVVDTGLSARKLSKLVKIGAPVTFDVPATSLGKDLITGKALDNRASVAALTALLHELQIRHHQWDVLVAATVQEEVTFAGGETIAWRTQPDLAIVVDVTFGTGHGVNEDKGFKLERGLSIVIGPNAHPKLFDMINEKAEEVDITLKPEPAPRSSGTEAWAVQVSRDGIPTAILGIPLRNMHTPVEIVSVKDIERAARLIAEFVTTLDDQTLGKLSLDSNG
jgi:putative aminopeptidase FrvX